MLHQWNVHDTSSCIINVGIEYVEEDGFLFHC